MEVYHDIDVSYICALSYFKVSVGGIVLLKDSKSEEPENLIEPLPGMRNFSSLLNLSLVVINNAL